jgi:glutathione S-transferase
MANIFDSLVLRSTVTSPFGRKVRMAIEVLALRDRIVMQPANPLDKNDSLRRQNPLGKMPCLMLSDGTAIYDSGVIIEYLAELAGDTRLLPARGLARYKALTQARLADGITEAALLMVYHRPSAARQDRPRPDSLCRRPARSRQDRYCRHRAFLRARLSRLAQAGGLAAGPSARRRLARRLCIA